MKSVHFIASLLCLQGFFFASGQNNPTASLFQMILQLQEPLPYIGWENGYRYVDLSRTPNTSQQLLVKNSKGLFVFVNGTGMLYKAELKNGKPEFTRLDSTIYFGYNVGSFPFSYNDSIYSLGGYGFWRVNGQLRVFVDQARQWDIVKLNEEIPMLYDGRRDLIWYDFKGKKIYIGDSFVRDEALKTDSVNEARDNYIVATLDLVKKEWVHKGRLTNYMVENVRQIKSLASAPWGELVQFGNKVTLIDYANNELRSLASEKSNVLLHKFSKNQEPPQYSYFFRDSTLYWGSSFLNVLDSFQLSGKDFPRSDIVIYRPDDKNSNPRKWTMYWPYYLLIGFVLLLTVGLIFVGKQKRNWKRRFEMTRQGPKNNLFDEKEMMVLKLLYEYSSKGKLTSIEELNKILGLSQKNAEIQKKQRSELLLSINHKYSFAANTKVSIIDKKRSDFDKRSFEYYIDFSRLKEIEKFLTD